MNEILRSIRNIMMGVLVLGLTFGFAAVLTAYKLQKAHMLEIQSLEIAADKSRDSFRNLCASGNFFKFDHDGVTYFCLDADALEDDLDSMLEHQDSPASKPKDGEYIL